MNQKTKAIGLFTILSLAMVAISPSLAADVFANTSNKGGEKPPLNSD